MRKIFADASAFGLNNGDTVTITLFYKIGQERTTTYQNRLITFKETIEITNNKLEIELFENDKLPITSYYELNVKGVKFRFQLNFSEDNLTHELISLIQLGSNDGIAYIYNDELVFENDFIKKIELRLTNQEPYFTENQERVFNFFVFYADYVHGTERTIDLEKSLDIQLSKIGVQIGK